MNYSEFSLWQRAAALCLLLALLLSIGGAALAQDRLPTDQVEELARSVVLIVSLVNGEPLQFGSGTIVDRVGTIYTNRHVVEGADDYAIYMLDDLNELPVLRYYAALYLMFDQMDFAILQINRDADGRAVLPGSLDLPFIDVASNYRLSDSAVRGDRIHIFGYPSIADGYLAVIPGSITTIRNGDIGGKRMPVWLQTDAEASPGNSGGLAVNADGKPIGIPTEVASEERTGGRLVGILPLSAVYELSQLPAGQATGPQQAQEPSGKPDSGQPPQTQQTNALGGPNENWTCDTGEAITNGTRVTVVLMRSGFTYTLTALGVGNFDPVIMVADSSERSGFCNDDNSNANIYWADLPDVGRVNANSTSAQVQFSQRTSGMDDMHLIVGGYNGMGGEVILILEGMAVTQADGAGDPFSVRITESMVRSGVPLTVYMFARDRQLDPFMRLVELERTGRETYNIYDILDTDDIPIACDEAGNPSLCWGESVALANPADAMLRISPQAAANAGYETLTYLMTSYERRSTGNYYIVFHLGLASSN
ncbi:MAG: S1 family peptidase [Aggregatilineales bacterium]